MASIHPDVNDTDEHLHDHVLHVQARYDDDEEEDGPSADPQLEGGMPLPIRLVGLGGGLGLGQAWVGWGVGWFLPSAPNGPVPMARPQMARPQMARP